MLTEILLHVASRLVVYPLERAELVCHASSELLASDTASPSGQQQQQPYSFSSEDGDNAVGRIYREQGGIVNGLYRGATLQVARVVLAVFLNRLGLSIDNINFSSSSTATATAAASCASSAAFAQSRGLMTPQMLRSANSNPSKDNSFRRTIREIIVMTAVRSLLHPLEVARILVSADVKPGPVGTVPLNSWNPISTLRQVAQLHPNSSPVSVLFTGLPITIAAAVFQVAAMRIIVPPINDAVNSFIDDLFYSERNSAPATLVRNLGSACCRSPVTFVSSIFNSLRIHFIVANLLLVSSTTATAAKYESITACRNQLGLAALLRGVGVHIAIDAICGLVWTYLQKWVISSMRRKPAATTATGGITGAAAATGRKVKTA